MYHSAMVTTVTGKNQVTVPAEIARRLGIRAGVKLDWDVGANEQILVARVLPDRAVLAQRLMGAGESRHAGGVVERLIQERNDDDTSV